MERWKSSQPSPNCTTCQNTFDQNPSLTTNCNMITPNGHSSPLKNPQNFTTGCNGDVFLRNRDSKNHFNQNHVNNGSAKIPEKAGFHLDLVKDNLCCLKQSELSLTKPEPEPDLPEEEEQTDCGLFSFKPQRLQRFANKKVFLAVFCLTSVLQGMYYTYFVSVLTTIEKLFQIPSKTTGLIMSATEIGQIGGALLLTYYGGHGDRPKWIACGMLVFAAASIFCATPHFMYSDLINPPLAEFNGNSTAAALSRATKKLCNRKLYDSYDLPTSSLLENSSLESTSPLSILNESFIDFPSNISLDNSLSENSSLGEQVQKLRRKPFITETAKCEKKSDLHAKTTQTVLTIFFITLLFIGIGATAVYTLGIPYIDDNVATRESPVYFGVTIGVRIFGPVFGFLLGSFCTSVYVNFPYETTEASTDDPEWRGAWWLGVLVVGAALLLVTAPMAAFPKKLACGCSVPKNEEELARRMKKLEKKRQKMILKNNGMIPNAREITIEEMIKNAENRPCEICQQTKYLSQPGMKPKKPSLKDFPTSVWRLLTNKILLLRTASSVLHILPIAGLYTFLPKYLESQFQLTATMANMISGIAGIGVMGIGIFTSGYIMRKYRPSPKFVAIWIAVSACTYAFGMTILIWFGCPLKNYVGLNVESEYDITSQLSCNATCICNKGEFAPICTSEGVTYMSPCLAGCQEVTGRSRDTFVYRNCTCLGADVTATNGVCPLNCNSLIPYIFVFALFVLAHASSEVGSMLLTLRCVEPRDKAMALGLISFSIGLFGNVPCPIIYGVVVDSACLFWEDNCGEPGACRIYDPSKFRIVFHGVTAAIMMLAFLVDMIVWWQASNILFDECILMAPPEETVPFNEDTQTTASVESSV